MGSTIKFNDPAYCRKVYGALAEAGYIVDIEFERGVVGLPGDGVMVLRADDDGIVVCELDNGLPMLYETAHIGYDEIKNLTII